MKFSKPAPGKTPDGAREPIENRSEAETQRLAWPPNRLTGLKTWAGEKLQADTFLNRWVLVVLVAILIAVILSPNLRLLRVRYQVGEVADRNIKSPMDLWLTDRPATEKKKAEAEALVPAVFDYDSGLKDRVREKIRQMMQAGRKNMSSPLRGKNPGLAESQLKKELEEIGDLSFSEEDIRVLTSRRFSASLEQKLAGLLEGVLSRQIVSDREVILKEWDRGIMIHMLSEPAVSSDESEGLTRPSPLPDIVLSGDQITQVIDLAEARTALAAKAKNSLARFPGPEAEILKGIAGRLISPNLIFNQVKTDALRLSAREGVNSVQYKIKAGEMIIREGEVVREDHLAKLKDIQKEQSYANFVQVALGILGLSLVLLILLFRFGKRNVKKFNVTFPDLIFLSAILLLTLLSVRLSLGLINSGQWPEYLPRSAFGFGLPVAAAVIMVRMLLNSETALIFAFMLSPLAGLLFEDNLFFTIYFLIGGLLGADEVRHCEQRIKVVQAGLWVGLANVGMIVISRLLRGDILGVGIFSEAIFGFAGGLAGAILVTGILPLIEYVFGYTTDIKLLELSNLEHPLLKDLVVQAPGTYHHSVVIGSMVEEAAKAIGANPLLARVGAYYHDVGKISKSAYFIENQKGGDNPHNRLTPRLSALILISHVKEGISLGRTHRIPYPILEIMAQHHGTSLIKYFYDKALSLANPEHPEVDEKDYRYPGPRPQSREGGLVLLADAVEAASRTVPDPTPARLQGLVQKIINGIFSDGQLDNCMLTLRDLNEIAKSFNRVLVGIYHQRIEYPEPAVKGTASPKEKDENPDRGHGEKNGNKAKEDKKSGPDDLHRLGLS
ncbi:MAG: HDIG domain-containing protein [bacterium]|nr:HDIG domain-containing protein [bacterium]